MEAQDIINDSNSERRSVVQSMGNANYNSRASMNSIKQLGK